MNELTIRVPGTTANLGPGYDCLGIALKVYNFVTLTRGGKPQEESRLVEEAARLFFEKTGVTPFPFGWRVVGDVPRSRGMGSSVTLRLGVLHGLYYLSGLAEQPVHVAAGRGTGGSPAREFLFRLCAELEGHPDNAAPAAFGGFTVASKAGDWLRFPLEETLRFVLLIPNFEMETSEARKVLPEMVPHKDAVTSLGNACFLTAALAAKRYDLLKNVWQDYLHQPYRAPLLPGMEKVLEAGVNAGALGGFLSGSGSTMACLTLENPQRVGDEMLRAFGQTDARVLVLEPDNEGTTIQKID